MFKALIRYTTLDWTTIIHMYFCFSQIHNAGGYGSEFEYDSEAERRQ